MLRVEITILSITADLHQVEFLVYFFNDFMKLTKLHKYIKFGLEKVYFIIFFFRKT